MKKNYLSVAARQIMGATSSFGKGDTSYTTKTRTWRLLLTVFAVLFSLSDTQAQTISNYSFVTNATGSLALDVNGNVVDMSSGTTELIAPAIANGSGSGLVSLPFDFWVMGVRNTTFSVSSHGWLGIGTALASGNGWRGGGTAGNPRVAPFLVNTTAGGLNFAMGTSPSGKVHFKVVGTAPNRTLVVEYLNMTVNAALAGATTIDATFQARLYETTGIIEFMYGSMNVSGSSPIFTAVGFSDTSSVYQSVNTALHTASTTVSSTPSYPSGVLSDLNSTSDGSRRNYRFSPPPEPASGPSALLFSSVTANTMTLNWTAAPDLTNVVRYVVLNSIDGGTTFNTVANVATGINTFAATALTAGTTYDWRVVAVSEGSSSAAATGTQATIAGSAYYWTGLTGSTWDSFANWNTAADGSGTAPTAWATSDTYIIDGAETTPGGALSIVVDRASFTIGQIFITSNTDVTLFSSATTTRIITISGGPGEDFILENGSSLNLNSNLTTSSAVAFAFAGSGNTGTIAGTYIASGSTSNTMSTTGGSGTLVTVAATGNITSNLNSSSGGISGNATSLLFQNGSNWTQSGNTTTNYIPNATWQPNATATLNGNTTGTSLTSSSVSLGNLVINTTLSTATLSAFTSNARTIQGNLTINSTGTGRFRALTTGFLTINGDLIVNAGTFEAGSTGGGVIVRGNTIVASGATVDIGRAVLQNEGSMVNNGSVLSSETTTTNSSINFLGTTVPQTFSGTGTFTGRISNFGVSNPAGLILSTPVLTQRVNLFTGPVTGSGNITIGTGLTLTGVVQIGTANNTNSGGSLDASPAFNLGTGAYALLYLGETTARTTGFEVPPARSVNALILDNINGLTLAGGTIEVLNDLTLTNGIVTSTLANHIIHGSATTSGLLTGGSNTSYINGPLVRTINDANPASNYVFYPVGIAGAYTPIAIAPTTTSASKFSAEAFGLNAGTADPSIIALSATRRFEALPVSGAFTDINVRLVDANLVATNIPVQAPSAAGSYSSAFGSTAIFDAGPPATITSNFPVISANYTGFLSFANSNACSGTPAPGNTIASATVICLGETVSLSLQNIPAGSGITYQWRSSTDGVTYTDIAGETGSSYDATPTAAAFYVCNVTCATGSVSGLSTPVQVAFSNTVTATTPATRCGTGTATLDATPSAGAAISWYDTATGGVAVASGNSFTTPSINATTTYFASAATASAGTIALGAGATASPSVGASFFPGFWGGAKTQYIIRASELTAAGFAAGNISSLGFEPITVGQTYQGFSVSLGLTTNTVTTTTFISSGLSQVYVGTLPDDGYLPVANTVNTLAFGTGTGSASVFNWDGTSNVVVSISWSRVPSTNTSVSTSLRVDNVGFDAAAHRQRDNITPAAMLAETSANSTSSSRPRFLINGQVLCESARVPVVATVTPPPALTLSAAATTICEGDTTAAIAITSTVSDYDSYVILPTIGVTGNETTGWFFNPLVSTLYTLTASQTTGSLCATTVTFDVTVNPLPSVMTIAPAAATVCTDAIQSLVVTGGTIGGVMDGQIGTATTLTGATSQPTAFCNRFEHYWVQMVYTAAELTAAGVQPGNITALRFRTGAQGSANNVTDFKVRLGNTTNSVLTAFTTSGLTQVFSVATYPTVVGVNTITFDTPYVWDGTSNVIVDMRQTGIDSTFNATTEFTATSGNTVAFAITSSTIAGGSDGFAGTAPSATISVNRLNTTFAWDSSVPTAITWSPATNLFTDAAATVAYVANANATTVYFKSSTAGVNNYIATATSGANCSVTATTAITAVDCAIPYANVQFPGAATITNCESQTFFARVFKAGVTEAAGQGAGIQAWIGRNTANTDPATWSEASWQLATFNVQAGNDDEYQATFGPSVAGTYYVASRFVFVPGAFVYGGFTPSGGGIWDGTTNVSAILTVDNVVAPTAADQTLCDSQTVADLAAMGSSVQWYTAATGGTALASSTALVTGTYFVSQTVNGCESTRTSVSVTIFVSSTPTGNANQTVFGPAANATIDDIVVSGTGIVWYASIADALAGTNPLAAGTQLVSGATYYAVSVVGNCRSAALAVTVTVTLNVASFDIKALKYYPNPVSDVFTVSYSQNITAIEVYDLIGRKVMGNSTNTTTVSVNMSELSTSVYVVKVYSENQVAQFKVAKK